MNDQNVMFVNTPPPYKKLKKSKKSNQLILMNFVYIYLDKPLYAYGI